MWYDLKRYTNHADFFLFFIVGVFFLDVKRAFHEQREEIPKMGDKNQPEDRGELWNI